MDLWKLLADKGTNLTCRANKLKIPVVALDNTAAGAHEFNIYYQQVLQKKDWRTITRTPSGGISITRKAFRPPMWDVRYSSACIELTLVAEKMIRIQFRQTTSVLQEETTQIYGRQAFAAFKKELLRDGIDLDKYAVDNGEEYKKQIPKYLIKMERESFCDRTFEGCHHIDFHNSFPAGLVNTHPEFFNTITRLYEKRKTNPIYKAILNYSIGFMQSVDGCKARWANLSRDAIADNNKRVEYMADMLRAAGRVVLSYNTDGIWYKGEIYHGEGEGKLLGQWENDHINCKFRAKSAGAYEFIENGEYHPVIRGRTNLDLIRPRNEWAWGDIYKKEANPLMFFWQEGLGIVDKENNLL